MAQGEVEQSGYGGPEQIQSAWRLLAGGAPVAAQALIDIAQHSESDMARVQASQAILNRVGLGSNRDVTVRVIPAEYDANAPLDQHQSPAVVIEQRMRQLREAEEAEKAQAQAALAEEVVFSDEEGIVEAEIVENED